ncbi:MAG: SH3 domain-containing protein [Chloroflexi bacterium]|nr:SH3 domain-containing protein [Chloroflexota bacterium]
MRKVSTILLLCFVASLTLGQPRLEQQTPASATGAPEGTSVTPSSTQPASSLELASKLAATPFEFPSISIPAPICEGAPTSYLIVHERARVTNDDPKPLNVRDTAGLTGKIVAQLETLDIFMIVDGPRCGDEYTWFKVRVGDTEGWLAEGDLEIYYVEPYLQ